MKGRLEKFKLHGSMVVVNSSEYGGKYQIVPKAYEDQVLHTANKMMKENVVVKKVPFYEISNESGTTAYIAKEM